MAMDSPNSPANGQPINRELLQAAVRLNTWLLALVFAAFCGIAMFVATYLSLYRGLPQPGQYLNLLGVFLPGYSVSHAGAWVGLCWGALIGGLVAVIFYRLYARSIEAQVQRHIYENGGERDLLGITLRLDGNFLGIAMGAIVAGGLLVTTNWLVYRGTANESMHAILLANFLPGYSVSPLGSLVGAAELFAFVYLVCLLFSGLYNRIVSVRGR